MENHPINGKASSGNLIKYQDKTYKLEILYDGDVGVITIQCFNIFNIEYIYKKNFTLNDFISLNTYFKKYINTYLLYRDLNDDVLKNISIQLADENSLTLLLPLNENYKETIKLPKITSISDIINMINELREENKTKNQEIQELKDRIKKLEDKINIGNCEVNENNEKKIDIEEDIDGLDEIQEMKIQEFNDKYGQLINGELINGEDQILCLWRKGKNQKLGNNGFKLLCEIKFPKLINLTLNDNDISNLNYLENFCCELLEDFSLEENKISDISGLVKANFPNLRNLNLAKNNLSQVQELENVDFKNLVLLNLSKNKIKDISVFKKVNFKYLKRLYLYVNQIEDISIFKGTTFKYLKEINLSANNEISDFSVLYKVEDIFPSIKTVNIDCDLVDKKVVKFLKKQKIKVNYVHQNKK